MPPSSPPSQRYVSPIGSLWKSLDLEKHSSISKYRQLPGRYAELKFGLDLAALIYLQLVVLASILTFVNDPGFARSLSWSGSRILSVFAYVFTLQPLLGSVGSGSFTTQQRELVVLALLISAVLFHESEWLKNRILIIAGASAFDYERFVASRKPGRPAPDRLTQISSIANHIFFTGILLGVASFIWSARHLPVVATPLVKPRLVFAGIILTVIGAFNIIKALGQTEESKSFEWINAIAAALVGATAFGTIVIVGLERELRQGKLVFTFAFVFILTTWIVGHFIVRPSEKEQADDISPSRLGFWEKLIHYGIRAPLMALGWVVNPVLIVVEYIAVRIQRRLARIAGWLAFRLRGITPYSLHMWLWRIGEAETISRHNDEEAAVRPTIEIVSQSPHGMAGYLHRPMPMVAGPSLDWYLRRKYLHGILEGDTWFTRWVKREPVRLVKSKEKGWDREDPLDFARKVKHFTSNWPRQAEFTQLYRHLIALILAVSFVSYLVKFGAGHAVAALGRPLLDKGFGYAILFGVIVGVLFALVTMLGKSSLSGLALGLISGLALAPELGAAEGLKERFANEGLDIVIGFVVTVLSSMLGENRLAVTGVLLFLFGLYLQVATRL